MHRAALTGKHDTLVRRAPGWQGAPDGQQAKKLVVTCQPGALRIHLTRLSTEGLGPRHGEVRGAHHMLNAALNVQSCRHADPCLSPAQVLTGPLTNASTSRHHAYCLPVPTDFDVDR